MFTKSEPMATRCIMEMLRENVELQESDINEEEIEIFLSMLRRDPLNPLSFKLLRATCECSGGGVDKNQVLVAEALMKSPDILATIKLQSGTSFRQDISSKDLVVKWSSGSLTDFSPLELYGTEEVPVMDLFSILSHPSVHQLNRTASIGRCA